MTYLMVHGFGRRTYVSISVTFGNYGMNYREYFSRGVGGVNGKRAQRDIIHLHLQRPTPTTRASWLID